MKPTCQQRAPHLQEGYNIGSNPAFTSWGRGGWAATPSRDSCKFRGARPFASGPDSLLPNLCSHSPLSPGAVSFLGPVLALQWTLTLSPHPPKCHSHKSFLCTADFAGWHFQEEEGYITETDKLKSILVILIWKSPLAMAPVEVFHSIWASATSAPLFLQLTLNPF